MSFQHVSNYNVGNRNVDNRNVGKQVSLVTTYYPARDSQRIPAKRQRCVYIYICDYVLILFNNSSFIKHRRKKWFRTY